MTLIDGAIYDTCLRHYNEVCQYDFVKADALPIPYFGDLLAYLNSPNRILTAALNPSDKEFPVAPPRFDVSNGRKGPDMLERELSQYFRINPYQAWFRSFEPVLNGLGASYGGKMAVHPQASTALHLDMCSPIATDPTWSKLSPQQRAALTEFGRQIFELLIDELKPEMVIASIGWSHIERWHDGFRTGRHSKRLVEYSTATGGGLLRIPLVVQAQTVTSRSNHQFTFINASAADKPFGRFSNVRKREVGMALNALLGGR